MDDEDEGRIGWVEDHDLEDLAKQGPLDEEDLEAAARELYAFVRQDQRRSTWAEVLREYAMKHLRSAAGAEHLVLDEQLRSLADRLAAGGFLEEDGDEVHLTARGEEDQARLYVRSHLTHVVVGMIEATVLWAACADESLAMPAREKVRVTAEHSAFTQQRALLEVITKTGSAGSADKETSDAVATREMLGIDEAAVPMVKEVLGDRRVFEELNRSCSHVGRRWNPPDPLKGAPLHKRVVWLTACVLARWRATSEAAPEWLQADWDRALAKATAAGGETLIELARQPETVDWETELDPFAAWPFARDWPTDPNALHG